jgi:hypothetical protein
MNPETAIIAGWLGYIAPFCMAATLIIGVWRRVDGKIDAAKNAADAANDAATEKAHDVEKQLSAFKLEVAKEYASWDTLHSIETRLTVRMDELQTKVMNMPDAVLDRIVKYLAIKPT